MDDKKIQKNGKSNLPNYMLFFFVGQLFLLLMLFCFGWKITKPTNVENDVSITESVDVQRSIKKAVNNTYINPSSTYNIIYFDYTKSSQELFNELLSFSFTNSDYFMDLGPFALYPLYCYETYDSEIPFVICILVANNENIQISVCKVDTNMIIHDIYFDCGFNNGLTIFVPPINYISTSSDFATITPIPILNFNGVNYNIGFYNHILSMFSSVPFEFECSSSPTYEMAPSSLVNDIPLNVAYPSGVHSGKSVSPTLSYPDISSKYYGSIFGNPLSVVGSQNQTLYDYKADLYINSSLRPKQNVFGFDDFISYYDTYDYLFTGFDIVLQTMWGQVPIYYKITTNDFGFAYDVSRLLNESNTIEDFFNLSITSDIEQRFLDYVHINIQFYFNADTNYDSKYFNVNEEYELEGLIPNTYYNGEYLQAEFGSVRYDADSFITNDEVVANGAYQTLRNYRIASSNVLNRLEQAYSDEYEQGYNEGYSAGVVDAGGENALGPVFAWFVSASSVIANIFSIEIFPYITLGMLLLFPLVVFIIVWLLKLFFGG